MAGGEGMEIKTPTKEERIAFHIRGVKMVLIPSLLGVLAGILTYLLFLNDPSVRPYSLIVLVLAIYVQKFIFPPLEIDSKRFGFKDWFFLSFMTFCFWFVTWTILLNGPTPSFVPLV
jgi:hypothetical protein